MKAMRLPFRTATFVAWLCCVAVGLADEPPALNPFAPPASSGEEPQAINPFGQQQTEREDAYPGTIETSDGKKHVGTIFMTRDKRLRVFDEAMDRQREVPLRVVKQIDAAVVKEWMEKEWRFKELALDEKVYTGRSYPSRELKHTITLHDDRTIVGDLSELLYLQPYAGEVEEGQYQPDVEPLRFILHKRQKGDPGDELKDLPYVVRVKLGDDALKEAVEDKR